jgi:hypothetical protein
MQPGPAYDDRVKPVSTSTSTATPENAAFALASIREASEAEDIVSTITNLAYSPDFLLIAEEYLEAASEQARLGKKYDSGNEFDLRLLCARCFIAGTLAKAVAEAVG